MDKERKINKEEKKNIQKNIHHRDICHTIWHRNQTKINENVKNLLKTINYMNIIKIQLEK